eukprot:scaffold69396_cov54-Phaeocystis_antarctica.AAC.2
MALRADEPGTNAETSNPDPHPHPHPHPHPITLTRHECGDLPAATARAERGGRTTHVRAAAVQGLATAAAHTLVAAARDARRPRRTAARRRLARRLR